MKWFSVPAIAPGLVLLASTLPGSAAAQDEQTPEGAQAFMSQVFSQGTTALSLDFGNGFNRVTAEGVETCGNVLQYIGFFSGTQRRWTCYKGDQSWTPTHLDVGGWTLLGSEASQPCLSTLATRAPGARRHVARRYMSLSGSNVEAQITYRATPPDDPVKIDWTRVAQVRRDGSRVVLRGINPALSIGLPSESLATRMEFAMEFLRLSCDPTAGTGF